MNIVNKNSNQAFSKLLISALLLTSFSSLSLGFSQSASSAITNNYDIPLKGKASWIGERFQGKKTASGELFDMNDLTASHATLPFGTVVKVVSEKTKKSVNVRINNRSEIDSGRVIDLSKRAAEQIGLIEEGVGLVTLEIVSSGTKSTNSSSTASKPASSGISTNSNPKYLIQYGSFFDLDNAIELKQGLKTKGIETNVESTKTDSGKTSYRVNSTKNYNSSDEAKKALSLVEPQDGIILSVKSPSSEPAKATTTNNKPSANTAANNSSSSTSKKYEYGIQFGAFETIANARELQNKLLVEKGIKTITYQFPDDSRKLYRVLTNHAFPSKEAAQKFLKEMESPGIILTFL